MTEEQDLKNTEMSIDIRDWGKDAKCKGEPAEWWYVENYATTEGRIFTRKAKIICGQCGVQQQCLEYANENNETIGVWGGLTPKERGVGRLARIERRKYNL